MYCNDAAQKPSQWGRHFYAIQDNGNGTVDVYMLRVYSLYEAELKLMRGVVPWPEIEDDIRARFDAWCESAETLALP